MTFTPADLEKAFQLHPADALEVHRGLEEAENGDHDDVGHALDYADEVIKGCGVESLRSENVWDPYYCDITLLYVNMGDPYVTTIWYDTETGVFGLGCWGDWLETWEAGNDKEEEDERES